MDSIIYNNVYIKDYYSIGGENEKKGYMNNCDSYITDFYDNEKTIEDCEIKLRNKVIDEILKKSDIDLIVSGDLSNQLSCTSYSTLKYHIPLIGVYAACATFPLSVSILAEYIENKRILSGLAITSSHNLTSEKQFRFPIEYGAIRKCYSTFTATGSCGMLLTSEKTSVKLKSVTIGKVIDSKIKDAYQMGGVMAISALDTLKKHLRDLNIDASYYDVIITGDLGKVGEDIFKDVLKFNKINPKKYLDAGANFYKKDQNTFSGASGPIVLPMYFFNKIIKSRYKKILLIGTGSLHSKTSVNQKRCIPSIAHAIGIEVIK